MAGKEKKLNKRVLTNFLAAAMIARMANEDIEMILRKEGLNTPVPIVYADDLESEPEPKPEEPVKKAEPQKTRKTRLSLRALQEHFVQKLLGDAVEEPVEWTRTVGSEASSVNEGEAASAQKKQPVRFLLQPFFPVFAFLAALFFTLVWPLPGLKEHIKEKFRSSAGYRRFSLLAKGLSVLLLLGIYFLIPPARRRWLFILLILWAALMLGLAVWTFFHRDKALVFVSRTEHAAGDTRDQ